MMMTGHDDNVDDMTSLKDDDDESQHNGNE